MAESTSRPGSRGSARPGPLVALSATYGAGGDEVGQRVAEALAVPLLGHAHTSEQMERAYRGGKERGGIDAPSAYLQHRVRGDQAMDDLAARSALVELESSEFYERSDAEVRGLVSTGGVVVGRAGPYVLRDVPGVLRVLLDGPQQARVAAGAEREGVDLATATRRREAHDASRTSVARLHYGADPADPAYYAVVLDTTALGVDVAVDLVVTAARALHGRTGA